MHAMYNGTWALVETEGVPLPLGASVINTAPMVLAALVVIILYGPQTFTRPVPSPHP